jgi:hypothetical protein
MMSQTIHIPNPHDGQGWLTFPDRCVYCGAARQAESTLLINRLVMRGKRQEQISLKYPVPHCEKCARSTKAVFLAGLIPFLLGMLLVGGIAFIVVSLEASASGLDEYGRPVNANSLVVGAAAGLAAGLVGGFLFELAARLCLLPFFGRALFQAPLLVLQFFNDADYVAGLTGKLDREGSNLLLTFSNDEIAEEFKALNTPAGD